MSTDQKWPLSHLRISYLPEFSRVPLTIVLMSEISTMVNGTLLNFGKRYKDSPVSVVPGVVLIHLIKQIIKQQLVVLWCIVISEVLLTLARYPARYVPGKILQLWKKLKNCRDINWRNVAIQNWRLQKPGLIFQAQFGKT